MRLGFFSEETGAQQRLADLAALLAAEGLRLAGAVQENLDRGADCACDMDLRVLGDSRPPLRISQSLGPGSSGCRLDAGALELAAARVGAGLAGADLLILSKFGKQEAVGRGFAPVIGQAAVEGVPVLIHVPEEFRPAFEDFTGGLAQHLAGGEIESWCRAAVRAAAA